MKCKCHIGSKTSREKEKLLVTSDFSFSHNVFHSYKSLVHQNADDKILDRSKFKQIADDILKYI